MLLKGMEFDTAHFITDVSGKYPRLWALKGAHPVTVNRWYKFGVLALIRTIAPGFREISELPDWVGGGGPGGEGFAFCHKDIRSQPEIGVRASNQFGAPTMVKVAIINLLTSASRTDNQSDLDVSDGGEEISSRRHLEETYTSMVLDEEDSPRRDDDDSNHNEDDQYNPSNLDLGLDDEEDDQLGWTTRRSTHFNMTLATRL
ncbi:hypothetical protein ACS0TY_019750 [Phlomoides rotata]